MNSSNLIIRISGKSLHIPNKNDIHYNEHVLISSKQLMKTNHLKVLEKLSVFNLLNAKVVIFIV